MLHGMVVSFNRLGQRSVDLLFNVGGGLVQLSQDKVAMAICIFHWRTGFTLLMDVILARSEPCGQKFPNSLTI